MSKENTTPKTEETKKEEALNPEEVNGNAFCNTHIKTACLCDCVDGTAWLSTSN